MSSTHRIFSAETIELNSDLVLDDDRARYVSRTLRLKAGDRFRMFDGHGGEFEAVITQASKGTIQVRAERHENRDIESPLPIRLLQGISRGDRMDTVVQKATELGVAHISPLLTEYSVVRLDRDRAAKRTRHWTRIAQSACEQCGRNTVPTIDSPAVFPEWFDGGVQLPTQNIVLHPGIPKSIGGLPLEQCATALLVGPEGGLSPAEVGLATQHGFRAASLGPRIMRTETATIAALAILQSRFGDI